MPWLLSIIEHQHQFSPYPAVTPSDTSTAIVETTLISQECGCRYWSYFSYPHPGQNSNDSQSLVTHGCVHSLTHLYNIVLTFFRCLYLKRAKHPSLPYTLHLFVSGVVNVDGVPFFRDDHYRAVRMPYLPGGTRCVFFLLKVDEYIVTSLYIVYIVISSLFFHIPAVLYMTFTPLSYPFFLLS